MARMISVVRHEYAGRELKAGDEFEVEDKHVQLLTTLGRATLAQTYETRVLTAEEPDSRSRLKRRNAQVRRTIQ